MPILLKTQVECVAKTANPRRYARVDGLCGFYSAAECVPTGSRKTGRCASVRERCGDGKRRGRTPAGGFRQREEAASGEAGQSCGVVRAPRRSHLPAVRAVLEVCEGVPKAAKNSLRALQYEKSPPFQGKRRGSNEIYEVNTEKW